MRIIFVRHGHPDYVRDCLTELGHQHAEAVAQRLMCEGVQQIYSSTCGRAFETAQHLANKLQLDITGCDFMREIKWGWMDKRKPLPDASPWTIADWMVAQGKPMMDSDWSVRTGFKQNSLVPHVRMIADAMDQWLQTLGYVRDGLYYRAAQAHPDTIAVFSHGGSSAAMLSHLFNLPFPFVCAAMGPDYTGITVVSLPDDVDKPVAPRFEIMNDARHIQGLTVQNIYGN